MVLLVLLLLICQFTFGKLEFYIVEMVLEILLVCVVLKQTKVHKGAALLFHPRLPALSEGTTSLFQPLFLASLLLFLRLPKHGVLLVPLERVLVLVESVYTVLQKIFLCAFTYLVPELFDAFSFLVDGLERIESDE